MEELSKKNLSDISAGGLEPVPPTQGDAWNALAEIGSICYKCNTHGTDWHCESGPILINNAAYRFQYRCNCLGADGIKFFDYSWRKKCWHGSWFID